MPESDRPHRGFEIAEDLTTAVRQNDNFRVLGEATAFAWYDEGILAVAREGELWALKPQRIIVATGSYDNPMVFENNDLPGIFLSGGLQRLMHRDFVRPGIRAAVYTWNDHGYRLALQLKEAGVPVAAIIDSRPKEQAPASDAARRAKDLVSAYYPHCEIEAALGRRHIKGVRIKPVDEDSSAMTGQNRVVACDVLGLAASRVPATELVFQRSSQGQYLLESPHQFTRRPITSAHLKVEEDLYVAGSAGGSLNPMQSWLEGKVAGLSAALDLGFGSENIVGMRDEAESQLKNFQD